MIVVTGGAGFIGSNIVKGLNQNGLTDILIVDNLGQSEKFRNLVGLRYADYCHKDEFVKKIEQGGLDWTDIDVVFHEGACSDTMEYNCNYMMSNNYEYSKTLLHFCLKRKIPLMYASSASTYGGGEHGFKENEQCEGALNIYAFSKLSFDRYVRQLLPKVQSQVVGLKYFNVYGPQENHKGRMASIVYQFYNQMKQNGYLKLFKGVDGYGDGEQRRDFVYVKDLVKVNLWFWQHQGANGIYNCGTGRAQTFNQTAQAVITHFKQGRIEYIDFPEVLKGKYQSFTEADLSNLSAAGYDGGFTELENAVDEYCTLLDQTGGYFQLD